MLIEMPAEIWSRSDKARAQGAHRSADLDEKESALVSRAERANKHKSILACPADPELPAGTV